MSDSRTTSPTPKQPRKRTFLIRFIIEGLVYGVKPLEADPSVAIKAYRFTRLGKGGESETSYAVRLMPEGFPECECKGFLRWGHCKHVRTLKAAGMLDMPTPAPAAVETPEVEPVEAGS